MEVAAEAGKIKEKGGGEDMKEKEGEPISEGYADAEGNPGTPTRAATVKKKKKGKMKAKP